MEIQKKCILCVVNQAIRVGDMVGLSEKGCLLREVIPLSKPGQF